MESCILHVPSHPPCWDPSCCSCLAFAVHAWHLLRRAFPCSQVFRFVGPGERTTSGPTSISPASSSSPAWALRPMGLFRQQQKTYKPNNMYHRRHLSRARRMPIGTIWRCLATELRRARCLILIKAPRPIRQSFRRCASCCAPRPLPSRSLDPPSRPWYMFSGGTVPTATKRHTSQQHVSRRHLSKS